MHELSLAESLIDQVSEIAKENGLLRVDEIILEVGMLKQVVPEFMQTAFEAVKVGSVAQSAVLKINEIKAQAECRNCQFKYEPDFNDFLCPQCQQADVNILQGDDIILKSIISYDETEK